MLKRILTGLCLIGVVTGFFLLRNIDNAYFELLIMLFIIIGTFEMVRAFNSRLSVYQKTIILIFSVIFVPAYHLFLLSGILGAFFSAGILLFFGLVLDKNSTLEGLGSSMLIIFYPSMLLSSLLFVNDLTNSTLALLIIFIVSPAADTMAYIAGITFKGKKLCPTISPNKTISGAVGGFIGGILASIGLYLLFKDSFVYTGILPKEVLFIIIGFVAAVITEFGDLIESVIKRKIGIKDMGKLLPGHGGIMDRIDGLTFASCLVFACFKLLI